MQTGANIQIEGNNTRSATPSSSLSSSPTIETGLWNVKKVTSMTERKRKHLESKISSGTK